MNGQRVRGEALAQPEVRGSIPPRIRERKRSEAFVRSVDQLLQLGTSTSDRDFLKCCVLTLLGGLFLFDTIHEFDSLN